MTKIIHILILLFLPIGCADNEQNIDNSDKLSLTSTSGTEFLYEPSISTLTGTITKVRFQGPPDYGDDTLHGTKESYPVLHLSIPIDVNADSSNDFNRTVRGITEIQLLSRYKLDTLLNKKVIVRGKIFGAQTGHHHTQVLLTVTELYTSR